MARFSRFRGRVRSGFSRARRSFGRRRRRSGGGGGSITSMIPRPVYKIASIAALVSGVWFLYDKYKEGAFKKK